MRKVITFAAGCALLALALACGGSGDSPDNSADPPQDATNTEVTRTPAEQLAIMVLPLEEYGANYDHLELDDDSGPEDSAEAADNSTDPADTAADMEARGYLGGYSLEYNDPNIFALSRSGVFGVSTDVQLFASPESAAAYMNEEWADIQAFVGQDLGGVIFTSAVEFEAADIGDGSLGAGFTADLQGTAFFATSVVFHTGSIVASANRVSTVEMPDTEPVVDWAEALEERIDKALDGSLDDDPVPLPTPEEMAVPGPDTPPFPEAMVLNLEDVADGATVTSEGYFDEDGRVSYEREMEDVLGDQLGGDLKVSAELHADDTAATIHFTLYKSVISSEEYWKNALGTYYEQYGGDADDSNVTALETHVGDDSTAMFIVTHTGIGDVTMLVHSFRVGRAVGGVQLTVFGELDEYDADAFAARMADKMAAELARAP